MREGGGGRGGGGGRSAEGRGGRGGDKKDDKKRTLFRRRKVCKFCADKIDDINYKDVKMLHAFVAERGKIVPRRISGEVRYTGGPTFCYELSRLCAGYQFGRTGIARRRGRTAPG